MRVVRQHNIVEAGQGKSDKYDHNRHDAHLTALADLSLLLGQFMLFVFFLIIGVRQSRVFMQKLLMYEFDRLLAEL